ncbi:MAG: DUF503 domain-containing protein [Chloroflexi bacterium]|nr:DUF503 domain-containing protein [Chloroflexota bacterium]
MFIGSARIVIHLPYSHSLKDKRATVRALLSILRQHHYAAAEVDTLDRWQLLTLGIVTVSNESGQAQRTLQTALQLVEKRLTEGLITDIQTEITSSLGS